jgi:hypothetical protein
LKVYISLEDGAVQGRPRDSKATSMLANGISGVLSSVRMVLISLADRVGQIISELIKPPHHESIAFEALEKGFESRAGGVLAVACSS